MSYDICPKFINWSMVQSLGLLSEGLSMSTEYLTYRELADRLGIKIDSARKTVQRKRWQRVTGNDGVVRVLVPIDSIPVSVSPADTAIDNPIDSPTVKELLSRIDALSDLLATERLRTAAAELDRDRWHAYAVRPWWKRLIG